MGVAVQQAQFPFEMMTEFWRWMVETDGGDGWWRRMVEIDGGDGWWRRMVETVAQGCECT